MGSLTGSCRKRRACILTFVPLFVKWSQNSHSLPARKPQPSHAHTLPAFTPALTQNRPLTKFPPSSPGDFPQGFQWRHGGLCGFTGTPARLLTVDAGIEINAAGTARSVGRFSCFLLVHWDPAPSAAPIGLVAGLPRSCVLPSTEVSRTANHRMARCIGRLRARFPTRYINDPFS